MIAGIALVDPMVDRAEAAGSTEETSLQDVKKRGKLVVGVDIPYGVMEFLDESGKPAGIDIDIAGEIVSALGIEMEIRTMPFDDLFGALYDKKIDVVISAVTITPDRQKTMLFSIPYLDAGMSIAVAGHNREINQESDLGGKRVGVLKGTVGEKLMTDSPHVDKSLLKSYKSNDKRIKDILEGRLDAIIVHFLAKTHPKLRFVEPPLTQSYYGIVTNLENKSLMEQINNTLRDMKRNGRLNDIKKKHIK